MPGRRPLCPDGHQGTVQRDKGHDSWSPAFERRSWRCFPADGAKKHRFTDTLPVRHPVDHDHVEGAWCDDCGQRVTELSGPAAGQGFLFVVLEAADVLVAVAKGESLRQASYGARERIDRRKTRGRRRRRIWEKLRRNFQVPRHTRHKPPKGRRVWGRKPHHAKVRAAWRHFRQLRRDGEVATRAMAEYAAAAQSYAAETLAETGEISVGPVFFNHDDPSQGIPMEVPEFPEPLLPTKTWEESLAGRDPQPGDDERDPAQISRECALAADYVDFFGPLAVSLEPAYTPEVLVIDAQPLRRRLYKDGKQVSGGQSLGEIGVFADGEALLRSFDDRARGKRPKHRNVPVLIRRQEGKDKLSWLSSLRMFKGPPPKVVVCDADQGLAEAVRELWPDTILYRCEEHMKMNAAEAAKADRIEQEPGGYRILLALEDAFSSPTLWQALRDLVDAVVPAHRSRFRNWMDSVEDIVLDQVVIRTTYSEWPRSNTAAEMHCSFVIAKLGATVPNLRNARRLNIRLALMRAYRAGEAKRATLASRIRSALERNGGRSGAVWSAGRDHGKDRSLRPRGADDESRQDRALELVERENAKRADRQRRQMDEREAKRLAEGRPPGGRKLRPGPKVYRPTTGLFVTDFPDLMESWDWEENNKRGLDPAKIPAGSGKVAAFLCRAHEQGGASFAGHLHRWERPIGERAHNATGCPYCMNRERCPGNTLPGTDPELAEELNAELNEVTADQLMRGQNDPVWWDCYVCGNPYQKRVSSRALDGRSCPDCERAVRKELRRQREAAGEREKREMAARARERKAREAVPVEPAPEPPRTLVPLPDLDEEPPF